MVCAQRWGWNSRGSICSDHHIWHAEKEGTMNIRGKLRQKCHEDSAFGCLGVSNFSLVAGLQQHREQRRTNRLVLYMHENHWKHDKMLRKFVQLIQQANDRPCSAGETSPSLLALVLLFKSNHVLYCSLLDNRNHDVPWSARKNWYTCNCNMNPISRNIKPKHFKRSSHLNHHHVATIQLIIEIG